MIYFSECKTLEEARTLYKRLARENHPDIGGDLRTMQEINFQYSQFQANSAGNEARERQRTAHAENRKSAADFHNLDEVTENIRIMIEFALNLQGVEIELMGLWVWLTGNTKEHREAFKQWNESHPDRRWKWSPKKTAWYYAGVPTFNRKETTLDEIRNAYGSQTFSRKQRAESELLNA
jgi:hypothetical protein